MRETNEEHERKKRNKEEGNEWIKLITWKEESKRIESRKGRIEKIY